MPIVDFFAKWVPYFEMKFFITRSFSCVVIATSISLTDLTKPAVKATNGSSISTSTSYVLHLAVLLAIEPFSFWKNFSSALVLSELPCSCEAEFGGGVIVAPSSSCAKEYFSKNRHQTILLLENPKYAYGCRNHEVICHF